CPVHAAVVSTEIEIVMKPLLDRLETWFQTNCPVPFSHFLPAVSPERLAALEEALGLRLPEAFKELYLWRNGQSRCSGRVFGDAYNVYDFMTLTEVQESHATLNDVLREIKEDDPTEGDTWWHPRWVPFLSADGDHFCVDTEGTHGGSRGQIICFLHDDSAVIESAGLETWLETFVVSLESGLWRNAGSWLELLTKEGHHQLARQMNPGYPISLASSG